MYRGCKTVVRSAAGESNSFGVEVGLHEGSALSPYLFLLLMDVVTEDVRKDVPGPMMFAYGIVLCGDDETDTTEYLETWRRALEDIGMRINRPKTQLIDVKFGQDNGQGRKEGTYLFDQTTIVNTIHIYENAMVRRLSLRLNIAASATATEIIIIII